MESNKMLDIYIDDFKKQTGKRRDFINMNKVNYLNKMIDDFSRNI